MKYSCIYYSPIGEITLASDGIFLTGLAIFGQSNFEIFKKLERFEDLEIFKITKHWLDEYFAGANPTFNNSKIKFSGTDFQKLIYKILLEIPYGELATYGEIANNVKAMLGKKFMSSQAVGGTIHKNPISIIVPCHRVVGVNGKLVGYNGGLDLKEKLLKLEKI